MTEEEGTFIRKVQNPDGSWSEKKIKYKKTNAIAGIASAAAKAVKGGKVHTSIYDERIRKCQECPNYNNANTKCSICGCYMQVKARIALAECPVGVWGPIDHKVKPGVPRGVANLQNTVNHKTTEN